MIKITLVNNEGRTLLSNDSNIPVHNLSRIQHAEFIKGGGFNGHAPNYLHIFMGLNPLQNNLPIFRNIVLPDKGIDETTVAGITLEDTEGKIKPISFLPDSSNPAMWMAQQPEQTVIPKGQPSGQYQSEFSKLPIQIEKSLKDKFDWINAVGVTLRGSLAYCVVRTDEANITEENEKVLNEYLLDVQDMLDQQTGKSWALTAEMKANQESAPLHREHSTFPGKLISVDNPEHVTPGQQPVTVADLSPGADKLAANAPFSEADQPQQQGVPLGENFQTYGASGQKNS